MERGFGSGFGIGFGDSVVTVDIYTFGGCDIYPWLLISESSVLVELVDTLSESEEYAARCETEDAREEVRREVRKKGLL